MGRGWRTVGAADAVGVLVCLGVPSFQYISVPGARFRSPPSPGLVEVIREASCANVWCEDCFLKAICCPFRSFECWSRHLRSAPLFVWMFRVSNAFRCQGRVFVRHPLPDPSARHRHGGRGDRLTVWLRSYEMQSASLFVWAFRVSNTFRCQGRVFVRHPLPLPSARHRHGGRGDRLTVWSRSYEMQSASLSVWMFRVSKAIRCPGRAFVQHPLPVWLRSYQMRRAPMFGVK